MNLDEFTDIKSPSAVIDAFNKAKPEDKKDLSYSLLYQWRKGIRSIGPAECVLIEKISDGAVTRKDLRDDWMKIWPEIA